MPRLFLALFLPLSLTALILMPPLLTFDAPSHLLRSVQTSEGSVLPDRFGPHRLGGRLDPRWKGFIDALWLRNHDTHAGARYVHGEIARMAERVTGSARGPRAELEFTNTAIYSPLNYLPQAIGLKVGETLGIGFLGRYYLGCLFNLAAFASLMAWTLAKLPLFRLPVTALALMPVNILMAATFSADCLNLVVPLSCLADALRLSTRAGALRGRSYLRFVLWPVVFGLLKPNNLVFLMAFLAVPPGIFGSRTRKVLVVGASCALGLCTYSAWNLPFRDVSVPTWFGFAPADIPAQLALFVRHPTAFFAAFGASAFADAGLFFQRLFGDVGPFAGSRYLNSFLPPLAAAALAGMALLTLHGPLVARRLALTLAAIGALHWVGTAFILWLGFSPVGSPVVVWLIPRYLPLSSFLLVVPLWSSLGGAWSPVRRFQVALGRWGLALYVLAVVWGMHAIFLHLAVRRPPLSS